MDKVVSPPDAKRVPYQDIKPLLDHPSDIAFFHHPAKYRLLDTLRREAGAPSDIGFQQAVDGFQFFCLFTVLHIIKQFIVTVDDNNQTGRAALGIFLQGLLVERIVHQIHNTGAAASLGSPCIRSVAPLPHSQILTMGTRTDRQIQIREYPVHRTCYHVAAVQDFFRKKALYHRIRPSATSMVGIGSPVRLYWMRLFSKSVLHSCSAT